MSDNVYGFNSSRKTKALPGWLGANDAPLPVGSFNAKKVEYPSANPSDYGVGSIWNPGLPIGVAADPNNPSPYSDPGYMADQSKKNTLNSMAPIVGGFGAASQVQPTTNASSAVMQTIGAGVSGAAAGAEVAGPYGAVVGGLVGVVAGGVQAYTGLQDARAQRRNAEKVYQDVQARADRREAQARADTQEQIRYNRRSSALAAQWQAAQAAGQKLGGLLKQNQDLKDLFIQQGR